MLMQLSCGCCGVAGICQRPLYGGTPQNADSSVSGYDRSWLTYFGSTAYTTVNGYKLQVTSADYLGFSGGKHNYRTKSRPFRWIAGGGTNDNNFVSDMCIDKGCENRFTGPPTDCHLGNVYSHELKYTVPVTTVPAVSGVTFTVEHARIYVDAVDVTGIFAESGSFADRIVPFTSSTLMTDKEIIIECWFKLECAFSTIVTTPRDAIYLTDISYPATATADQAIGKVEFTGGDAESLVPNGSKFRLTFDANGPGGVSSLDLEPQSGWSFSSSSGIIEMIHAATLDVVVFDYSKEVPTVDVTIPAATYPTMSATCLYGPQGTQYESVYKYRSTGLYVSVWTMPQRGVWTPGTSQDFTLEGRRQAWTARLYGVYYPPAYIVSLGASTAMYTAFPAIVSVECV